MRFILAAPIVFAMAHPAQAQSTPPPPRNAAGSVLSSTAEQMGQVLFSAAEKSIIEGFFGHSATATAQQSPSLPSPDSTATASGRILKQVLDTVTGQTTASSREGGSEGGEGGEGGKADDDGDKGKKNKKHKKDKKAKNKGKGKNNKMPPGLAKRKSLPPGLQKQFEKNGRLPPGLANRELPGDLTRQLPPAKTGTERVISGSDMVLVDQATGVILDILRDVVTGRK